MATHHLSLGTQAGLAVLSDQWYALIIQRLNNDFTDFMTLREAVRGISTFKILISLSKLDQMGLINSNADYQYRLTPNGQYFQQVLNQLETWGNQQLHQSGHLSLNAKN